MNSVSNSPGEQERKRYTLRFFLEFGLALLIAFCFTELTTRFVVSLWLPPTSPAQLYEQKYLVARGLLPLHPYIIGVGDSLMKQGIYPELMTNLLHDKHVDVPFVNMAVNGGSQEDAIKYLDYLRSKGVVPLLLIFPFSVENFGFEQPQLNMHWGQTDSYLYQGILARPHNLLKKLALLPADYSLFVRHRGSLKHKINEFVFWQGSYRGVCELTERPLRDGTNLEISRMGMGPCHSMLDESLMEIQRERFIKQRDAASPKKAGYIFHAGTNDLLLNYCQKWHLNLCFVWLPHIGSLYDKYFYAPPYTHQYFRDLLLSYRRYPNVSTLDLNTGIEDLKYFDDFRHLSTYGNLKTTERLADCLLNDPQFKMLREKP